MRFAVDAAEFVQVLQMPETEFLEISSIRDTRTGKYAKTPRVRACREGEGTHALGFGTLVKWREPILFTPRDSDPLNFPSSFGRAPVNSSLLEGQDDRCRWQRDKRTPDQEQRGPVTVTSIRPLSIACNGIFPPGKNTTWRGRDENQLPLLNVRGCRLRGC
ncbi:hypothetical protein AVEN_124454-1 [Araneus ventricosus]|uniref:Uncharacterized protein n=1 Tax=Araneus ventricosus TaxID=182803 RepID=A0A4Y2HWK2_ARAVE|nr:hypothetical protein AVEN_124454-1 [Araneus ventricosus]